MNTFRTLAALALVVATGLTLTQRAVAEGGFSVDEFLDDALATPVQQTPAEATWPWLAPGLPPMPADLFGGPPARDEMDGRIFLPANSDDVPWQRPSAPLTLGIWGCGSREGVILEHVAAGSLAQRRGYEPGDAIVSVNGRRTDRIEELQAALREPVATFVVVVRDVRTGTYVADTIRR